MAAALLGRTVIDPKFLRYSIVAALLVLIFGLGFVEPDKLLIGLVVWLAALGMIRRMLTEISTVGQFDPILIVAPFALAILAFRGVQMGAFKDKSPLAKAVLTLTILLIVEALNPLQASISAGVVGLVFLLVPIGAFWIGRSLSDKTLRSFLVLIIATGILGAAYGLMQTFRGFPSWDQAWIATNGYGALSVLGRTRPFGTFSSASEYGVFLAVALVICLILWGRPATLAFALTTVIFLGVALFYQSSRGNAVFIAVAIGLIVAAWLRVPAVLSLVVVGVALFGLVALVRQLAPTITATSPASALAAHEVAGLSNPLNANSSTLGDHLSELELGVKTAFRKPFGTGDAGITIAGSKFGTSSQNTESDPSNMAVALGLPGLITYLIILGLGMFHAYKLASVRRDALAFACLGLLAVTLLQWLNGGQYAVAFLPWIALGWVDARWQQRTHPSVLSAVEATP